MLRFVVTVVELYAVAFYAVLVMYCIEIGGPMWLIILFGFLGLLVLSVAIDEATGALRGKPQGHTIEWMVRPLVQLIIRCTT